MMAYSGKPSANHENGRDIIDCVICGNAFPKRQNMHRYEINFGNKIRIFQPDIHVLKYSQAANCVFYFADILNQDRFRNIITQQYLVAHHEPDNLWIILAGDLN